MEAIPLQDHSFANCSVAVLSQCGVHGWSGAQEARIRIDLFSDNKLDEREQKVAGALRSGWVAGLGG